MKKHIYQHHQQKYYKFYFNKIYKGTNKYQLDIMEIELRLEDRLIKYEYHLSQVWDNIPNLSSSQLMNEYINVYNMCISLNHDTKQLYDIAVNVLRKKTNEKKITKLEYTERGISFGHIMSYVNRHVRHRWPDLPNMLDLEEVIHNFSLNLPED